jgi:membrane dipeptidase
VQDLWGLTLSLIHFFDNAPGGSLHRLSGTGLTNFDREVVARTDALTRAIDPPHASPTVAREVLVLTRRPAIVSHSGIRPVCDVKCNFPDALLQAVASAGGLIAIGYWLLGARHL